MVFVLKEGVTKQQIDRFIAGFEARGFSTILSHGTEHTVVCLIGNTATVDVDKVVQTNPIVSYGKRVTEPYKAVNRAVHADDTIVDVAGRRVGAGFFHVIAGPCSVEGEEQILTVAHAVKSAGASLLRGGAFKPRTSPYSFSGLKDEGIRLLLAAKRETGLPIVTEILSAAQLPLFEDVDVIQIGARNMQNFDLLREVGSFGKPVLLKRGFSNTIEEFLMSAEHIMSQGNTQVMLCERGIRTFETATRNTLDLSAVPLLKERSHLPVLVDPSHAAGLSRLVPSLSRAAIACGADALMIEVHDNPAEAMSDGAQSLDLGQFEGLMKDVLSRAAFEGRDCGD